jgi:hypothetical protein
MVEDQMVATNDPRSVLDKATDAVNSAAEAVQSTTESIAGAIEDSKRRGGVLDQVTRIARESPLRALALAFLVGWIVARRRYAGSSWMPWAKAPYFSIRSDPKVVERRLSRRWGTRGAIAGLKEMADIVEVSGTDIDEAVLDPIGFTPLNFDPRAT